MQLNFHRLGIPEQALDGIPLGSGLLWKIIPSKFLCMSVIVCPLCLQAKEQQRAFAWYYFYATVGVLGGELGMPVLRQTTGFVISLLTVAGERKGEDCVCVCVCVGDDSSIRKGK